MKCLVFCVYQIIHVRFAGLLKFNMAIMCGNGKCVCYYVFQCWSVYLTAVSAEISLSLVHPLLAWGELKWTTWKIASSRTCQIQKWFASWKRLHGLSYFLAVHNSCGLSYTDLQTCNTAFVILNVNGVWLYNF